MGIAELILLLIVSAGIFIAGKKNQKAISTAIKSKLVKKEKEIHEEVSNADLQSLVDNNNSKLGGK